MKLTFNMMFIDATHSDIHTSQTLVPHMMLHSPSHNFALSGTSSQA